MNVNAKKLETLLDRCAARSPCSFCRKHDLGYGRESNVTLRELLLLTTMNRDPIIAERLSVISDYKFLDMYVVHSLDCLEYLFCCIYDILLNDCDLSAKDYVDLSTYRNVIKNAIHSSFHMVYST
ncbi:hypothetical protein HT594_00086 [Phenacoccus solenopsis nudivirus]|nr:hypothetical protein HT594_00086 [Phenacoccus solenopsis nudivirus]